MAVLSRFRSFARNYPILRGMLAYSVIWPTSYIIQQTLSGKTYQEYNYMQALRFSLYGSFFVAPTLFCWIRVSTHMWPGTNLRTAITKALVEQVTYGPAAMACFFFGMTLLEGKSIRQASEQVENKFIPSYKVAICFSPFLQTINFCFISERNRVPFVSACSLVWICFLSFMHQIEKEDLSDESELLDVDNVDLNN